MKRKGMDLSDVLKISRFDGRLGVEGEAERGPRMTSKFSELYDCVDGIDSDYDSGNMRKGNFLF